MSKLQASKVTGDLKALWESFDAEMIGPEGRPVVIDAHDAKVIRHAIDLLEKQAAQITELLGWRSPEVWEVLEDDCSMENLTKALRHGRAMEARVVSLEKGLLAQNSATGLIPAALHALKDESGKAPA